MKRVTGIGGIFFNANDPVALRAWYKQHLGIDVQVCGVLWLVEARHEASPRMAHENEGATCRIDWRHFNGARKTRRPTLALRRLGTGAT